MTRQQEEGCCSPLGIRQSHEPPIYTQVLMRDDAVAPGSPEEVALTSHCEPRQLVRLIQCPRCSKPFSTPVTLPCGHTVCRGCLPAARPRENISYPNTPDRLTGISCPLMGCGAEHASADCNVDVTLTKVMEIINHSLEKHRPVVGNTPILLEELVHPSVNLAPGEEEKEKPLDVGHQRLLHGGRLVATYTMAEMGELRYGSELDYKSMSETGDQYEALDLEVLNQLRDVVRKELDCLVCYNLMLDPTTTPCGHTFCRRCLGRVMDHSSICPVCRRELYIPASLQNTSSNALLNSLLNGLCPELIVARAAALSAEEQVGNDVLDTPLFVCTLSLPTMPTFLHIFEPRYRLMMRRCLEGNRQFGMVMYNRNSSSQGDLGPTQFLEYGTMLEIINFELLRDGRSFVETRGVGRFRIRAHGLLDGYHVGRVERVEDVSLAEEGALEQRETSIARDTAELFFRQHPQNQQLPANVAIDTLSTQQLLDGCVTFIREMRHASAPWLRERIIDVYGEPPTDPALFPYWFACVLPIAEEEKYLLLRTTRVRERLKIVYSWIGRIRGQRWGSGSSCSIL